MVLAYAFIVRPEKRMNGTTWIAQRLLKRFELLPCVLFVNECGLKNKTKKKHVHILKTEWKAVLKVF